MSRPILVNVYKHSAEEIAVKIGKSAAAVKSWRTFGKLPHNPEVRAQYLKLERLIAGPGLRLQKQARAKAKARKRHHA